MRGVLFCSAAIAMAFAAPARAGDKVLTGSVPAWVTPAPPIDLTAVSRKSEAVPLLDQQVRIDGNTVTTFVDTATFVSSPEMLNKLGTLSVNWLPHRGDVTFHRIEIVRGGQTIDALQSGVGFTILRREAGLERLMVTGQLTAVKHIEGLQIGDVLHTTLSITERDSVLGEKIQGAIVLPPAPAQIRFGRARLVWRSDRAIAWKALMPGVSSTPKTVDPTWSELVVPLPAPKLPEMPKNIPSRFQPLPLLQFSSFPDWKSVAGVMAPLYSVQGTIAPDSDLAGRVDAIAKRSSDPIRRMADALRMVQEDVRYQLMALGQGNYVPQSPAETWTRRYGDCKAKTLLLLAVLDRLGIKAEPVLASSKRGDAVPQMLPSAMAFDHVFVRARAGDEDYWLDGTMTGSRLADIHDVPPYGHVLPLFSKDSALVDLPHRAHARADLDVSIDYDMTNGPHLPAPFRMALRYSGPYAATNRVEQSADYDEKLISFAESAAKNWVDTTTIGKPQAVYDPEAAQWLLTVEGVAYPDWTYQEGRYSFAWRPTLKIVYDAPRDRASWRTIPALIQAPWTANSRVTIKLPNGGKNVTFSRMEPHALIMPAVEWRRSSTINGGEIVEEIVSRESGAEIPGDKISTAAKSIAEAMDNTIRIELPAGYLHRWDDVARMRDRPAMAKVRALFDQRIAAKPDEPVGFADRAWLKERLFDWEGAEADYGKAIALDGTTARYLARASVRAQRGDHAGALKDAQAAHELEQGNNEARDRLAAELARTGQVDAALDLLPSDPDVNTDQGLSDLLQRVEVLELAGNHPDALELLDRALEKHSSSAPLRNARCWFQALNNGNLDVALADCNRAIELASNPAAYLDSRAMVHFRAGDLEKARSDYDAALASAPEQAASLFMSGVVLGRLGQKDKAGATERAARTISPDIDRFFNRYGIKP